MTLTSAPVAAAIDGTVLDLPDTAANEEHFGRPGSGRGEMRGAFAQARVVALVECGTHAMLGAEIGPCSTSETKLAPLLFKLLNEEMLLLVDRGFSGYELWQAAAATGARSSAPGSTASGGRKRAPSTS